MQKISGLCLRFPYGQHTSRILNIIDGREAAVIERSESGNEAEGLVIKLVCPSV